MARGTNGKTNDIWTEPLARMNVDIHSKSNQHLALYSRIFLLCTMMTMIIIIAMFINQLPFGIVAVGLV